MWGIIKMKKQLFNCVLGLAVGALTFAQPVQAASCWNQQEEAAAKIRDLQSRLMVSTLRCRAMGIDVLENYNEFVRANRSTIQAANGVIKAQFTANHGSQGQTQFDRFTTSMANEYGADPTNRSVCADAAAAASEAAAANGDLPRLLAVADRLGSAPKLPGGQCPITLTAR